jgi:hypothetical protein
LLHNSDFQKITSLDLLPGALAEELIEIDRKLKVGCGVEGDEGKTNQEGRKQWLMLQ